MATKEPQEAKITPIDIHSDEAKKKAGLLWYDPGFERDPSIWTKTDKEKAELKKIKKAMKGYKFYSD